MNNINVRIEWDGEIGLCTSAIKDAINNSCPTICRSVTEIPSGPVDCVKMFDDLNMDTWRESKNPFRDFIRSRIQPAMDAAYQRGRDDGWDDGRKQGFSDGLDVGLRDKKSHKYERVPDESEKEKAAYQRGRVDERAVCEKCEFEPGKRDCWACGKIFDKQESERVPDVKKEERVDVIEMWKNAPPDMPPEAFLANRVQPEIDRLQSELADEKKRNRELHDETWNLGTALTETKEKLAEAKKAAPRMSWDLAESIISEGMIKKWSSYRIMTELGFKQ